MRHPFKLNNHGIGIAEVIVASAIFAITAGIVAYTIVHNKSSSGNLSESSICHIQAESIIQNFKQGDNKASIFNWLPTAGHTTPTTGHVETDMYPILTTTLQTAPILSPTLTNAWELIDSGTNWALGMATANPGYCALPTPGNQHPTGLNIYTSPGTPATGSFSTLDPVNHYLVIPNSHLTNEADYLNIRVVDTAGNYKCPSAINKIRMVPASAFSTGPYFLTGANLSMQLDATVTYTDSNNKVQTCTASTKMRPDGDNAPPVFVDPRTPTTPGGLAPNAAQQYCGTQAANSMLCVSAAGTFVQPSNGTNQSPVACDQTSVKVNFQTNEAAVVFGCELEYSPTYAGLPGVAKAANTYLCGVASPVPNLPLVNVAFTPYTGSAQYGSGGQLTISGAPLAEGFYRLFVTAYDSGENTTSQVITFGLDLNRPTAIQLRAPLFISPFGLVPTPARSHVAVAPPWNTALKSTFGAVQFQCEDATSTDIWTQTSTQGLPVTPDGAYWSYVDNGGTVHQLSPPGQCVVSMLSPTGLPSGNYSMTATACDSCGAAAGAGGSSTIQWSVDEAPAPVPGHAPTTLVGGANFIPPTVPAWTLSPTAKPAPLPAAYSCQNADFTISGVTMPGSCNPTGFTPNTECSAWGSTGMCTAAFDGCGRGVFDTNTPYQMMASLGQSCCNVPCIAGLICAMDSSLYRGQCVNTVSCSTDSQCPGGICYKSTGTCYGASAGPSPQTCGGLRPSPPPTPAPTPTPTPTVPPISPTPTATVSGPPCLGGGTPDGTTCRDTTRYGTCTCSTTEDASACCSGGDTISSTVTLYAGCTQINHSCTGAVSPTPTPTIAPTPTPTATPSAVTCVGSGICGTPPACFRVQPLGGGCSGSVTFGGVVYYGDGQATDSGGNPCCCYERTNIGRTICP